MAQIGIPLINQPNQAGEDQRMDEFFRYGLSGIDHTNPAHVQAMFERFPNLAERGKKHGQFRNDKEKEIVRKSAKRMLDAAENGSQHDLMKEIDNNAIVIQATGDPGITPDVLKVVAYENPSLFKDMMRGAYRAAGGDDDKA